MTLTKNADPNICGCCDYATGFDERSQFSLPNDKRC